MAAETPTKTDLAASLLATLEATYGDTDITTSGFTWSAFGRDLELVVTSPAGDRSLDAVIWDTTEPDPVQLQTVRLHVEVIA